MSHRFDHKVEHTLESKAADSAVTKVLVFGRPDKAIGTVTNVRGDVSITREINGQMVQLPAVARMTWFWHRSFCAADQCGKSDPSGGRDQRIWK